MAQQLTIETPVVGGMDLSPISTRLKRKIDFILGAEFLSQTQLKIDPGPRTLDFYPPGALVPPANFPSLAMEGFKIEIKVGDKPARVSIDTGVNSALILTPEAWARVAPPGATLAQTGTTGANGQYHVVDSGVLPAITVGQTERADVRTQVRPWPGVSDGTIGMGLLGDFFLVFDAKNGKLWLAPRLASAGSPRS